MGIPAVNIGERQKDRENSINVINVGYKANEILRAVKKQLKIKKFKKSNLFGKGDAGKKIVNVLSKVNLNIIKRLN